MKVAPQKLGWFGRIRRWLGGKVAGEAIEDNGYVLTDLDVYGLRELRAMVFAWQYRLERLRGGNQFTYLTDSRLRDVARLLERYNPIAQGILSGLEMYVLGNKGMHEDVVTKPGMDDALKVMGQNYLDAFKDRENWWDRQRELFRRSHRDGEMILRFYDEDGITTRFLEPEYIVPRDGSAEWSFGFRNRPGDIEKIEALNIMWQPEYRRDLDQEEVLARDYYHIKLGVDRTLKRGISDFASTCQIVEEAMKCLKNMMRAETIRQGITYITQHPNSTPQDVNAYIASQTNYVDRVGVGPGSAVTNANIPVSLSEGVGEIHLPGTQELASAPSSEGTEKAIAAMNAALLAVGARYHMPQWLINGDASRNNAIDLGGESPFGRYCAYEQELFARHQRAIYWRVLALGVERGDLPEAILDHVDILVTPQVTFSRDPDKETDRNQKLSEAGLLSDQTWSAREGLDYETEQERRAETKRLGPLQQTGKNGSVIGHYAN